ncbi:biopolymer transporter ExbD [Aporhodopirellula aestuarii]|uniref:Biopolymer transporter ExbD n=1 Tax=Aporhodopirellula aestuarii TaxID=2950107 RepID=A0ABT0U2F3_9BACT|nr:biopolymer transporter ExbD [Aporhodopirellula aestuarii]MCM2371040.1 biopolymer transporter ExbD [Aporhodopirellula aestuarii]
MKAPPRSDVGHDDLAMTSMIDVVFLLLVFFVWTSSFDKPESDLASRIAMPAKAVEQMESPNDGSKSAPTDTEITEERREELVIQILSGDRGPTYQIGAIPITSLADVRSRLAAMAALRKDAIVIIDPDDAVAVADCIDVFDAARRRGFANVLFAVESP